MGFITKAFKSVFKAVKGIVGKVIGGVFGFLVGGKKKDKAAAAPNNLTKSLNPDEPRKIVFGRIASPLDTRYWEVWGNNGQKFDEVIASAGHRINAYKELYIEDDLAIDSAGVVQGKYAGVLTRDTRTGTVGQTGMVAGGGTQYNAASVFEGCAAFKLAWVPDEKKLPNGIPSRYTQVVEGALVYDPRRDSTVAGGSGTHRIADQTTWAYATLDSNGQPIGRNNALQALWYIIGWRIANKDATGTLTGDSTLVAGRGVDYSDINLASFIAGANACEAAGYYTDLTLSTEEEHSANEDAITADGLIGRLLDPGGLWSYYANVDDTANIAVTLTDADVLESGSVDWNEYLGLSEQFNQVGGKYVKPESPALFQSYPYPLVRDATYEANLNGLKRRKTIDFRQVLDNVLAQRLARLALNQGQYQAEFNADFNYKALRAQAWSIVQYQSDRFGWTKLFRVWRHEISTQNGVGLTLREVHPSIWTAGTVAAPVAPGDAIQADALLPISPVGLGVSLVTLTGADGTKSDGFRLSWTQPSLAVRRTEIQFRQVGAANWINGGSVGNDVTSVTYAPLFSGTQYEAQIRHISVREVPGPWTAPPTGNFTLSSNGNLTYAQIQAAASTANWSAVFNDNGLRPENGADVTGTHVASAVTGQGQLATQTVIQPHNFFGFEGMNLISDPNIRDAAYWQGLASGGSSAPTIVGASDAGAIALASEGAIKFDSAAGASVTSPRMQVASTISRITTRQGFKHRMAVKVFLTAGFNGQVKFGWFEYNQASGLVTTGAITNSIDYRTTPLAADTVFELYGNAFSSVANSAQMLPYVQILWGASAPAGIATFASIQMRRIYALGVGGWLAREDGVTDLTDNGVWTGLGVASGINSQGALATLSSVGFGTAQVTGFGALAGRANARFNFELYENDGTTLATVASYRTSSGVASAIASQGALATLGSVAYGSAQVTGFGTLAGRSTARFANEIYRANGTTVVNDIDAVTSLGVASGIASQGALATLGSVAYGSAYVTGFGALAARTSVRFNNEIYRANGTTLVNDIDAVTSLGVASGIASQGALATLSNVDYATLVVGTAKPENNSDITRTVDGPLWADFKHSSAGVAETGEFPRDLTYKLVGNAGTITSGITWTYAVVSGTVNTFTSASGAKAMTGAGTGVITVSSLGSSTASVEIRATYGGVTRTRRMDLTKTLAAPVAAGSTMPVVKNSSWTPINSTTFTAINAAVISGTMPTGKTTANITATLSFAPSVVGGNGNWTVEAKVQRNTGTTGSPIWTDKGVLGSASSSVYLDPDTGLDSYPADITLNVNDTGLTAGTTYEWRVVARITAGTKTHNVSPGTVTVSAP